MRKRDVDQGCKDRNRFVVVGDGEVMGSEILQVQINCFSCILGGVFNGFSV